MRFHLLGNAVADTLDRITVGSQAAVYLDKFVVIIKDQSANIRFIVGYTGINTFFKHSVQLDLVRTNFKYPVIFARPILVIQFLSSDLTYGLRSAKNIRIDVFSEYILPVI